MTKYNYKELASKKMKARHMIIVKGYTQKEVAALVDISETTISKWAITYKWKEEATKELTYGGGLSVLMEGFFDHVKHKEPALKTTIQQMWKEYLQSIEATLGIDE